MSSRALTIIEQTVLGIVYSKGTCSRYTVMLELRESGSGYYRSLASSAYPAVERLVKFGYVRRTGADRHVLLEITERGLAQLREWILSGADATEISQTRDLLRLRIYFFGCLEPDKRRKLLTDSLAELRSSLALSQAAYERSLQQDKPCEQAGIKGVVYEAEARVRWIEDVFDSLVSGMPGTHSARK